MAIAYLNPSTLTGMFTRMARNDTIPWSSGAFTSIAWSAPVNITNNHFLTDSCMRHPNSPIYLKSWTWKTLFFLVPLYTLASAFRNLQPFTTKSRDLKQILAMVIISSVSFAGKSIYLPTYYSGYLLNILFS